MALFKFEEGRYIMFSPYLDALFVNWDLLKERLQYTTYSYQLCQS